MLFPLKKEQRCKNSNPFIKQRLKTSLCPLKTSRGLKSGSLKPTRFSLGGPTIRFLKSVLKGISFKNETSPVPEALFAKPLAMWCIIRNILKIPSKAQRDAILMGKKLRTSLLTKKNTPKRPLPVSRKNTKQVKVLQICSTISILKP